MTVVPSRALVRLSAAGMSAGLVLAAAAGSANATTTTFNNLTSAQVLASLPAPSALPAGTKLAGKVKATKVASATPCGTGTPKVSLTGATGVAAIYTSGKATASSSSLSVWTISAAVFGTHAQAAKAAATLAEVQAKCPPSVTTKGATLTRTVLAPDTSEQGLWKGVRGVYHLTVTDGKVSASVRLMTTWFERGNVLVQVSESAPITSDSGARQDALRKAVTVATLEKLDAAAA